LILIIAVVVITVSVVVGVAYVVATLVRIRETTIKLEGVLQKINKISDEVASMIGKVSSPTLAMNSLILYGIASIIKIKRNMYRHRGGGK